MNSKRFAVVAVAVAVLTFLGLSFLLQEETGCSTLASSPGSDEVHEHVIAVELAGNTQPWQSEVTEFVRSELRASGAVAPQLPLVVRVRFLRSGDPLDPAVHCLKSSVVLQPASGDLDAFEVGSDETRVAKLKTMLHTRERQIGWVAEAVSESVQRADFSDVGPDLVLSPLSTWAAASQPETSDPEVRWVSVLSPLASTTADCLNAEGKDTSPGELVEDCIAFEQLAVIQADYTRVSAVAAANPSQLQRREADGFAAALCEFATSDGCSRPGE